MKEPSVDSVSHRGSVRKQERKRGKISDPRVEIHTHSLAHNQCAVLSTLSSLASSTIERFFDEFLQWDIENHGHGVVREILCSASWGCGNLEMRKHGTGRNTFQNENIFVSNQSVPILPPPCRALTVSLV